MTGSDKRLNKEQKIINNYFNSLKIIDSKNLNEIISFPCHIDHINGIREYYVRAENKFYLISFSEDKTMMLMNLWDLLKSKNK